ncbi:TPA: MbeD/MobD family mobilization/exclusion protein [Klebsiella variicola subsp. variicola]
MQSMFTTTSAALMRSDQACQHLSGQVDSLRQQVMSLTEAVSRLTRR